MSKDLSFKAQQREALQRKIDAYLAKGGRIETVPPGVSGAPTGGDWQRPARRAGFTPGSPRKPEVDRTPLTRVMATIDARKQQQRRKNRVRLQRRQPRRKLLYDDFGEPLRWQWVDE
ncbi:hypothetical protein [Isoalcanivorax indicus]|uniref:hypothetical protein n=1 Tax=Isoalcanivorax indicus TaxID=2202653 RepID=UPI000DB97385|nr:hypothetical protein [Isoalcanivorax indicus]